MTGSLITIGKSGALAARAALELTGQNIANAGNAAYTRRSLALSEVAASGGIVFGEGTMLSGVRSVGIARNEAVFLQGEARRTGSDAARAEAEVAGLLQAEAAVEQSGLYPAITAFEASLARLSADPLAGALRDDALENARALAQTFGIAAQGLAAAEAGVRATAEHGVAEVNRIAQELARNNAGLARLAEGSAGKAALLDQRDTLLAGLAGQAQFAADFDAVGRVAVRLGGTGGPALIAGTAAASLELTQGAGGAFAFTVDGQAVTLGSGGLAGHAQALVRLTDASDRLDALAGILIDRGNMAQAAGVTPAGMPGGPLFSGGSAGTITLALEDGTGLATAPHGSGPGSRNTANLDALRIALADNGPAAGADAILSGLSSAIAARTVTRDVLTRLADAASRELSANTGVDLDAEAANLLRFQQAFQANGKVMQAAVQIFDTMLRIG